MSLAASSPTTPGGQVAPATTTVGAAFLETERHERFGFGLGERLDLDPLANAVQAVELDRDRARFEVVGRGQEADAEARVAYASAGVDARPDEKAQMLGPRRTVGARDVEQSRKPRTAPLAHDCEPLDDKGAVEADQRYDVGDGGQRHEIERGDQVRGRASVPEARLAQRAVQRHQPHVDDTGGAEITQSGKIVLPVGIDQRQRPRQRLRGLMMIKHDHVEAEPACELERLAAYRAAIDCHEELGPLGGEVRDRLAAGAVAFGHAVRDVDDRLAAAGAQILAEQRRAARAVDVVVAENGDTLAAYDRPPETLGRRLHVAQHIRVGHQIAQPRIEMALRRLWADAAPGENTGDQFFLPAGLRDGERAQFPVRVETRPPRPAEGRAFDVEKVAGGRHVAF